MNKNQFPEIDRKTCLTFDNKCMKLLGVQQLITFIGDNKFLLIYLVVLSVIAYGGDLTHFSLTIDEELYVTKAGPDIAWLQQERWGMYLVNWVFFPNPIMPFFPLFFTLICTAFSFVIIARMLSPQKTYADYVAAPLYVAFPILYYIYTFYTINFGIGFAFLSAAISMYIFVSNKRRLYILSLLLASFSIGIYQAMSLWLVALFLIYVVMQILKEKEAVSSKRLLSLLRNFFVFIILAHLIYFLIEHLFLFIFKTENNSYIDKIVSVTFTMNYWTSTLSNLFLELRRYYFSQNSNNYLGTHYVLTCLFVIPLLISFYLILRSKKNYFIKALGIITIFFIPIIPFGINLLSNGYTPAPRLLIALPLVFGGLVYFAWQINLKTIRLLLIVLVAIYTYNSIVINTKLAFSNYLSWQADQGLTVRLLSRLDANRPLISPENLNHQIPLIVNGYYNRPPSELMLKKDTIGSSFYFWDLGNPKRVISLMKTMGVYEYAVASAEQKESLKDYIKKMPTWPNLGSVAFKNGIAIINFGVPKN